MSIGVWQVILILVIVLIIFGAGKLPRVMGDVAKGIKNFKAGMSSDPDKDGDANAKDDARNDDGKTIEGSATDKTDSTSSSSTTAAAREEEESRKS